jgi:hypothetical protein
MNACDARGLMKSTAEEERKVEAKTGKPLAKGAKRVEERSRSSDGQERGRQAEVASLPAVRRPRWILV